MSADQEFSPDLAGAQALRLRRLAPLAALAVLIVLVYAAGWHRELTIETLLRHRATIDAFIAAHQAAAVLGFIALYATATALATPSGLLLAMLGGLLFGTVVGGLSAMIGSTVGATVIFLVARSALGEYLLRLVSPRAEKFAAGFRADAFSYIVFLRLIPVPSWFTNLTAAFFGVPLATFLGATVVGRTPGSIVFALFGAGLGSAIDAYEKNYQACLAGGGDDCRVDFNPSDVLTPTLLAALIALGCLALLPVAARRFRWWRAQSKPGPG